MHKILVVDDENDMCLLLNRYLAKHGYEVQESHNGKDALQVLDTYQPDLVFCDFRLGDMTGDELLKSMKEKYPAMPVIMITAYCDTKTAVEVMKLGAQDYLIKPFFPEEILATTKRVLDSPGTVEDINTTIRPASSGGERRNGMKTPPIIFGDSPTFKAIHQQIELVAPTNYSVIIYGETGSGKEAIAQEIHKLSKRSEKPFIAIDCGALPKELAASELFGHEKGSFTGAVGRKIGSFELANGGTIFLDEIANLPYEVQVSLLRVIQERKMHRVGSATDIDLDIRILVASNEKLWGESGGNFREDLYHRFNEFTIHVPPLRERRHDIPTFAYHFLKLSNEELDKNVKGFTKEVEDIFLNYPWHGNLRELKNVIKRCTLLTNGEYIELSSLPFELSHHTSFSENNGNPSYPQTYFDDAPAPDSANEESDANTLVRNSLKGASIDAEYEMILEALKQVNFNKSKAAKLLNIDRKTLYNKMKQYQQHKRK